jgi:hypothetical protein
LAEKIANAREPQDAASKRLAEQRTRAQQLRAEIDELTRQLEQVSKAPTPSTDSRGGRQAAGDSGRADAGNPEPAARVENSPGCASSMSNGFAKRATC